MGTEVPYVAMRLGQAFFGWLLVPTSYLTAKALGMTLEAAILTSTLVLFGQFVYFYTDSIQMIFEWGLDSKILLFIVDFCKDQSCCFSIAFQF